MRTLMLNRIVIMGRLGHEPEVQYTQSSKPVASFSLAVDRDFKDKASGERATDWIDVVAWDAKAKFVQQYFHNGQQAVVEGRSRSGTTPVGMGHAGGRRRWWRTISILPAPSRRPQRGNAPEESLPPSPESRSRSWRMRANCHFEEESMWWKGELTDDAGRSDSLF